MLANTTADRGTSESVIVPLECGFGLRIGNLTLPLKSGKFGASAAPHCLYQFGVRMADEIWKRRRLAILFTHENQRNKRRQDDRCSGQLERFETDTMGQTVPQETISHLIVILRKDDETFGGNVLGRAAVPALAEPRVFAGIREAIAVGIDQMLELAVIFVVAAVLASQQRAQGVMKVIAPDGIQTISSAIARANQTRVVSGALRH